MLDAQAPKGQGAGGGGHVLLYLLGLLLSSLWGFSADLKSGPGLGYTPGLTPCPWPVWYSFFSGPQALGTQS